MSGPAAATHSFIRFGRGRATAPSHADAAVTAGSSPRHRAAAIRTARPHGSFQSRTSFMCGMHRNASAKRGSSLATPSWSARSRFSRTLSCSLSGLNWFRTSRKSEITTSAIHAKSAFHSAGKQALLDGKRPDPFLPSPASKASNAHNVMLLPTECHHVLVFQDRFLDCPHCGMPGLAPACMRRGGRRWSSVPSAAAKCSTVPR